MSGSCMGSMIARHCCVNWICGHPTHVCSVVLLDAFGVSKPQPPCRRMLWLRMLLAVVAFEDTKLRLPDDAAGGLLGAPAANE
jgi:hypothetical protein